MSHVLIDRLPMWMTMTTHDAKVKLPRIELPQINRVPHSDPQSFIITSNVHISHKNAPFIEVNSVPDCL